MTSPNKTKTLFLALAIAAASAVLSCNGGGGGEDDADADTVVPPDGAEDVVGDDAPPDTLDGPDVPDVIPDTPVDDVTPDVPPPPTGCAALPPPTGETVTVTPSQAGELRSIVAGAATGTTILLEDGDYAMNGGDDAHRLMFSTPGVTLRSASGNRDAVRLDGGYVTTELVSIYASDITIADVTLMRAYYHPIHISGSDGGNITGILVHNVHIIDPGQQAVKINPSTSLTYADQGVIECSLIELTDEGRPNIRDNCYTGGVDAHAAWGWIIRLNEIRGFWCDSGLSEHAVHMWRTCRDTVVEANIITDCARGIGFGMGDSGTSDDRVYADNPYPEAGYLGHIDGIIRNNFIFSTISGFDAGITLEQARGTDVVHNTVVSLLEPFSSIEWRWGNTSVQVANNLVSHNLRPRDGAQAELLTNIENADTAMLADASGGDLHLAAGAASAIDAGTVLSPGVCDTDIDGEERDSTPDIGADEYR